MRHGSLFSGIGGFDLAAEWMGWENVFHCEWNPFGQKVLHHYWPNSEQFTDITKSDFTKYANKIDILTGGFPCQPYSSAGKRLGKEDERHLWPEMLRAIREIQPRWIVGENVRGLTNWNGGLVFDEVCSDLENLGYQVAPFIIPASATNAPHQRERIWFVAHTSGIGTGNKNREIDNKIWKSSGNRQKSIRQAHGTFGTSGINATSSNDGVTTNAERIRLEYPEETRNIHSNTKGLRGERDKPSQPFEANGRNGDVTNSESFSGLRFGNGSGKKQFRRGDWSRFPTQPPVCGGNDGLPTELDGITFSKWRNESIKAYGNAIVPNVVFEIFKAIEKYENL